MTEEEILAKRIRPDYNCCHLVCDAWPNPDEVESLRATLTDFLALPGQRTARAKIRHSFVRCPPGTQPVSPSVVILRRGNAQPHVGIYDRGLILHLTKKYAIRQPLHVATLGYRSVRFYALRPTDY